MWTIEVLIFKNQCLIISCFCLSFFYDDINKTGSSIYVILGFIACLDRTYSFSRLAIKSSGLNFQQSGEVEFYFPIYWGQLGFAAHLNKIKNTSAHWKGVQKYNDHNWDDKHPPRYTEAADKSAKRCLGSIISISNWCHGDDGHPNHVAIDCANIAERINGCLGYSKGIWKDGHADKESKD